MELNIYVPSSRIFIGNVNRHLLNMEKADENMNGYKNKNASFRTHEMTLVEYYLLKNICQSSMYQS